MKRPLLSGLCAALALTACAVLNTPINQPLASSNAQLSEAGDLLGDADGAYYIGLAFSGGGTRASAFAYGMLEEMRAMTARPGNPDGILKDVRLVSGVSGGSVTAAYFGFFGPAGLDRFRDIYLVKDAGRYMANSVLNPLTLVRGLSGGANGRNTFGRFLDETLFHGATFGELAAKSKIKTWINATDIANNVTFIFNAETFDALCSDLSKLPLSEAVIASANRSTCRPSRSTARSGGPIPAPTCSTSTSAASRWWARARRSWCG
jgi:NTE family protein